MSARLKYRNAFAISVLACSLLFPAISEAKTVNFTCGGNKTLSAAIRALAPGDILLVSGTCNENVVIPDEVVRVTIDGQGSATINGSSASDSVLIRGRNITITGFTITGGQDGVTVFGNASATIAANVIQAGRNGIVVVQSASARMINNTIQNNPLNGILVTDSSSARIGFLNFSGLDNAPGGVGPNQVVGNGGTGIGVIRSSSAIILGNNISDNLVDGVAVTRGAYADISGNVIDNNGSNGILVIDSSAVRLGEDTGTALNQIPNTTTTGGGDNTEFGIACARNSAVRGRLGTLNGTSGATTPAVGTVIASCVMLLNP